MPSQGKTDKIEGGAMNKLRLNSLWCFRYYVICLLLLLVSCGGGGGSSVSDSLLKWSAPSEREDGTKISLSEIQGYRIYYGTDKGIYPNQLTIIDDSIKFGDFKDVSKGSYYVVITTLDTEGRESAFSEVVVVDL